MIDYGITCIESTVEMPYGLIFVELRTSRAERSELAQMVISSAVVVLRQSRLAACADAQARKAIAANAAPANNFCISYFPLISEVLMVSTGAYHAAIAATRAICGRQQYRQAIKRLEVILGARFRLEEDLARRGQTNGKDCRSE